MQSYVDDVYLQRVYALFSPIRERSFDLMDLECAKSVLDVGCGPGLCTVELAGRIGADSEVVGVDLDESMVVRADDLARRKGVGTSVRHAHASAEQLPFPASSFDAARSERMLQYLPDPQIAVDEMLRVLRPGGRLALVDTDWGSFEIDCGAPRVSKLLLAFNATAPIPNGRSGRRLSNLLRSRGVRNIESDAQTVIFDTFEAMDSVVNISRIEQQSLDAGALSADEVKEFRASAYDASARGSFFATLSVYLAAGRRDLG